jgi:glycosyltransferase involved in cell wall biosynthesis
MSKQPISIIIPAFKASQFIEECLDSIQTQTYFRDFIDYEILLGVDYCQETLDKLEIIKLKYPNLRIFWFDENVGPYVVKNTLVSKSECDILVFFDADDIMFDFFIDKNIELLKENSFVSVRGSDFKHPKKKDIEQTYNPNGAVVVFKQDFLNVNGYADWRCAADFDLIKRLEMSGVERITSNSVTMLRRLHEDNITSDKKIGNGTKYRNKLYKISEKRKDFKLKKFVLSEAKELCDEVDVKVDELLKNMEQKKFEDRVDELITDMEKRKEFQIYKDVREICKTPISIIISVNTGLFIEECLKSIQEQTYFKDFDNYEILLGVNGNNELLNRLDILKNKNTKIRIFWFNQEQNSKVIRNTLITKCNNSKIVIFNENDLMLNNFIDYNLKSCNYGSVVKVKCNEFDHPKTNNIISTIESNEIIIIDKKIYIDVKGELDTINHIIPKYVTALKRLHKDRNIEVEKEKETIKQKEITKFVYMISTYNRKKFLEKTITTWNKTRNRKYQWTLIISDDGSTDGTLKYLDELIIDGVDKIIIKNNRRGIHHQTNSLIKSVNVIDYDFGFKSDDDIIFLQKGWDDLYFNTAKSTDYYHLIFFDKEWGGRRKECKKSIIKDNCLENCVDSTKLQGAFWTFNKNVLEDVGYFDTNNFNLCGIGHNDFSLRCCRLGYNDIKNPFDVINSNNYITLNKVNYTSPDRRNDLWNTPEIVAEKKSKLLGNRTYIPYNQKNMDIDGKNIEKYDLSFIIPLRNREENISGMEYNIKKMFSNFNYEILYINQNDNLLFKRGQLCNIGFKESKGDIIIFQDVDIRHLNPINPIELLNMLNHPFVAFDKISQLRKINLNKYETLEIEERLNGWGACAVFHREHFIASGGFSNLVFGWGAEDNIMNNRIKYKRYNQILGHIYHKPLRKNINYLSSQSYKNNLEALETDSKRNKYKDGYIQSIYDSNINSIDENIHHINVKNIKVPEDYEYIEQYRKYKKEDL